MPHGRWGEGSRHFGRQRSLTPKWSQPAGQDRLGVSVKTLHIASILTFSALIAFACSDDDDSAAPAFAGAGDEEPTAGSAGKGGKGGSGGSTAGSTSVQGGMESETAGMAGEAPLAGTGGSRAGSGGDGGIDAGGAAGQGGATPVECDDGSVGGAAGAGGAGPELGAGLEIIGTWKESFGDDLEISSTLWNDSFIKAYDNATNVVYTQTPCDSAYFPGAFSKYVYLEPTASSFYYCTIIYDAKTLAEAQASAKTADEGNLLTGCNGFPWSEVTKP
jgi:hypothetical protein